VRWAAAAAPLKTPLQSRNTPKSGSRARY